MDLSPAVIEDHVATISSKPFTPKWRSMAFLKVSNQSVSMYRNLFLIAPIEQRLFARRKNIPECASTESRRVWNKDRMEEVVIAVDSNIR